MSVRRMKSDKESNKSHVQFISYDGKWSCLCMGSLVLKIDGKEWKFGNKEKNYSFWSSGGHCGFSNGYEESHIESGEWIIEEESLPEELRKYVSEIDEVFNDNVEYGCCGGCL